MLHRHPEVMEPSEAELFSLTPDSRSSHGTLAGRARERGTAAIAGAIIVLAFLCGCLVWEHPPDVNEAHYLAKAKHFHDPGWCRTDLFVGSPPAHWLFYLLGGWPTRFLSLESTAWCGRVVAWLLASAAMVSLFRALNWRRSEIFLFAPLAVLANQHLNFAGEWFVGGMEAKSFAWPFALFALAAWIRGRALPSVLMLAIACGLHIVIGAWVGLVILIAARGSRIQEENWEPRQPFRPGARRAGIVLVLFIAALFLLAGLIPALALNRGASPESVVQANSIQAFVRLAHHQDPFQFEANRWFLFLSMVAIWRILVRATSATGDGSLKRLDRAAIASLGISAAGLLLAAIRHVLPEFGPVAARVLILYLFRTADVLVPLAVVARLVLWSRVCSSKPSKTSIAATTVLGVIFFAGLHWRTNMTDSRSAASRQAAGPDAVDLPVKRELERERNWIRFCRWVSENTPPEAIFITPSGQQTFKWYASRGEVANWKDMPQDAGGVVEWFDRWTTLYGHESVMGPGVLVLGDEKLRQLGQQFGAHYLIAETWEVEWLQEQGDPTLLHQVHPEPGTRGSTFTLFDLQSPAPERPRAGAMPD